MFVRMWEGVASVGCMISFEVPHVHRVLKWAVGQTRTGHRMESAVHARSAAHTAPGSIRLGCGGPRGHRYWQTVQAPHCDTSLLLIRKGAANSEICCLM